MSYRIEIAPAAERQIRKLEPAVRKRLFQKIETLESNPRQSGVEKLTGSDFYRLRVGDYRIIYEIEDRITRVLIVKVGNRKEIYKR